MNITGKIINPEKLEKVLRERLESDINENRVACAEILVNQNGKRILTLAQGHAHISGEPLRPDIHPIYRIASMTKPVTATAVVQQWEKGRIDLEAPVADYLPEYHFMMRGHAENGRLVLDGPAEKSIRVFHLLTHTNGIDIADMHDVEIKDHPRKTLKETAEYYSKLPLAFEPFTSTGYSESAAFDLAARIVELVSGEEYEAYVRNHIFRPLGMKDTAFELNAEQEARLVGIHNRTEDGTETEDPSVPGCVFEDMPYSCRHGGGGLASTAEDYIRFAEMFRRNGTGENGERILTEEGLRLLASPHVPDSIQPGCEKWGFGVRVVTGDDYPWGLPVGTFGWSGAYGTHFWVDPVNQITALYMRNSNYDSHGCGNIGKQFEADVMSAL